MHSPLLKNSVLENKQRIGPFGADWQLWIVDESKIK